MPESRPLQEQSVLTAFCHRIEYMILPNDFLQLGRECSLRFGEFLRDFRRTVGSAIARTAPALALRQLAICLQFGPMLGMRRAKTITAEE